MKLWKAKCSPQLLLCFRKVSEPSVCSSDDTTWRCIQSLQLLQLRNFRNQRRSDSSDSYDKEKALKKSQDLPFTHSALIHTEYHWRSLKIIESCWRLLNIGRNWSCRCSLVICRGSWWKSQRGTGGASSGTENSYVQCRLFRVSINSKYSGAVPLVPRPPSQVPLLQLQVEEWRLFHWIDRQFGVDSLT